MSALENILSHELVQKLGWTLLHFIRQATAVALLAAILLRIMRRFSANIRYITACLTLGSLVLLPVVTMHFVKVESPPVPVDIESISAPVILSSEPVNEIPLTRTTEYQQPVRSKSSRTNYFALWKQRTVSFVEPALPHIVTGWIFGVFALSLWHLGGWAQLQKLRKKMVKQVDAQLVNKLNILAKKLGVTQSVELLESALVQIPTVVGWLRPVILLPASAFTGLSTEQLEAILAHELAHIKRFDYLVNMMQTIVEILGFYHPAVWWLSHKIRVERENCCDDLAVTVTKDRICYARALTSLEEIRGRGELAVAAAGGNLLSRIRRLIGKDSSEKTFSWIPAIMVILLLIILIIPTTLAFTSNYTKPLTAESLLEKMLEHRSQVKNLQYIAEENLWRDVSIEAKMNEDFIEQLRQEGEPQEILDEMRDSLNQIPESRYQILKCTLDNEERIKIEITNGAYNSSGNKIPEEAQQVWIWNGISSTNFSQQNGYPGSAIIENSPNVTAGIGHPWRTFTGILCEYLEEAITKEISVNIEKLNNGTYRITFDYVNSRYVAIVEPSQGYTCTLQESYNKQGELYSRSTATYKEVAENIWFPVSGQTELYTKDGSLFNKSIVNSSQIRINDPSFNAGYFDVDIPVGATVRDRIRDKEYVVGVGRVHDLNVEQNSDTTEQMDPNSWQEKFYSIYSLKDGEVLKRISPFIPERREYLLSTKGEKAILNDKDLKTAYIFQWNGNLESKGAVAGSGIMPITVLMQLGLNLNNYEFDDPANILQTIFAGDWIIRKKATVETVLGALEKIFKNEMGRDIEFSKQEIETEVITVKGKYDFHALPNVTDGKYVLISTTNTDTYTDGGGGTGTLSKFLTWVGNRIKMNIIDNTESTDITLSWRNDSSSDIGRLNHNEQRYNTQLDMLLKNLSRQTGLAFEKTKITTEKWLISENGASKDKQETNKKVTLNQNRLADKQSDERLEEKLENSTEKLKKLGLALAIYAADNDSKLPETLDILKPYLADEQTSFWVQNNVVYLGKGIKRDESTSWNIPTAYDKSLLQSHQGTNVLFLDAHVEFVNSERLKELGIRIIPVQIEEKLEISTEKLKQLGLALAIYAADNDSKLPETIDTLKPYLADEQTSFWVQNNVTYLGKGRSRDESASWNIPIAYDKSLLKSQQGANVLFLDAHVEFVKAEKLKELGIGKTAPDTPKMQKEVPPAGKLPESWSLYYDDGLTSNGGKRWPANMAENLASLEVAPRPFNISDESWKNETFEFDIHSLDGARMGDISVRPEPELREMRHKIFQPDRYLLNYRREWGKLGNNFRMNCGPYLLDLSRPGMYNLQFSPKLGEVEITGSAGGCYAVNFEKIDHDLPVRGFAYINRQKEYTLDGLPPGKYRLSAVTQQKNGNVLVSQAEATVKSEEKVTVDIAPPPKGDCSLKGTILGRRKTYSIDKPISHQAQGEWYVLIRKPGNGNIETTFAYEALTMDSFYVVRGNNITQDTTNRASYKIEGIVPGEYTVTAIEHPSLSDLVITRQQSKPLILKAGQEAVLDFDLRENR